MGRCAPADDPVLFQPSLAASSQDMFVYVPSGTSVLQLAVTVNVSGSCAGRSITR